TLREQGVSLDFGNWRGVVAPAGLAAADRAALLDVVDRLAKSATWKELLRKHNWDDAYLGGDAYAAFLKAENDRITQVLKSVGLVK
ncbi:MAG TPA: tripartite tricarboxylate transporter substrate binding protein, partial [Methylomirabilota bacterium]|nr:tripartite tricarboxylate transporter substrate binding protein [Methylomirabilota bacterium]